MAVIGKTSTGFEYSIDDKRLNNVRLRKAIFKLEKMMKGADEQNTEELFLAIDDVCLFLLGAEREEELIRHLESIDEDGICTNDAYYQELTEILNSNQETKNSGSLPE